jgi:hypothetical protein
MNYLMVLCLDCKKYVSLVTIDNVTKGQRKGCGQWIIAQNAQNSTANHARNKQEVNK